MACLGRPLDAVWLRGPRAEAGGAEAAEEAAGGGRLLRRVRRGWMWNQFFLQEEYTGSEHQYIGKVRGGASRGPDAVAAPSYRAPTPSMSREDSHDATSDAKLLFEGAAFKVQCVKSGFFRLVSPERGPPIDTHCISFNLSDSSFICHRSFVPPATCGSNLLQPAGGVWRVCLHA